MELFLPTSPIPEPIKPCTTGVVEESETVTLERCKCEKDTHFEAFSSSNYNRKHILSFQPEHTLGDIGYSCMDPERIKCKAFWSFIDSTQDLQSLIHNGRFVHLSKPTDLNKKLGKELMQSINTDSYDRDVIPLPPMPLENKFRIEKIKESFQHQQKANKLMEEKFGLQRITEKKLVAPDPKSFCAKYWEKRNEAFQLSLEMDKYDKTKWYSENEVDPYLEFEDFGEE